MAGVCPTFTSDSTDMTPPDVSREKGESDSRTDSSESTHSSTHQHPHEPPVAIPTANSSPSAWSSAAELDSIWESMVKVTLASFGGSLVGLALENQRRHHHNQDHRGDVGDRTATRRRPPTRQRQPPPTRGGSSSSSLPNRAAASLPGQWALSCLFFALAMEASRHASPTTLLLKMASSSGRGAVSAQEGHGTGVSVLNPVTYKTVFLTSFGDYAIGGAVSGTAGGWALASRQASSRTATAPPTGSVSRHHQAPTITRRAGLAWGLRVGAVLGVAAGVVQAAVDVAGMYYAETQQHPGPATKSLSQPRQAPTARVNSAEEGAERRER